MKNETGNTTRKSIQLINLSLLGLIKFLRILKRAGVTEDAFHLFLRNKQYRREVINGFKANFQQRSSEQYSYDMHWVDVFSGNTPEDKIRKKQEKHQWYLDNAPEHLICPRCKNKGSYMFSMDQNLPGYDHAVRTNNYFYCQNCKESWSDF